MSSTACPGKLKCLVSTIQLVGKKYRDKTTLASKTRSAAFVLIKLLERGTKLSYEVKPRAMENAKLRDSVLCLTGPFDKDLFEKNKMVKCVSLNEILEKMIKAEFTRKLRSFNFQWAKTLYQNNLYNIAFFFTFFKG